MSGLLGVLDPFWTGYDKNFLAKSIDLQSAHSMEEKIIKSGFFLVSFLNNKPLKGSFFFEDKKRILFFLGDLIDYYSVPWEEIIQIFDLKKFSHFKKFEGNYSIACWEKNIQRLTLVSDRRSQQPLYYMVKKGRFIFSSNLSTFCRLDTPPAFDERWLYDYFFFNFPVKQNTFLKGVKRMPPATLLVYDHRDLKLSLHRYATKFKKKRKLLSGIDSYKLAYTIFNDRIPKYYQGSKDIACALTDGWDGRTMLAFAPCFDDVVAYTYGVPGCADLRGGKRTAKLAGFRHINVDFDKEFISKLPDYILNTVRLSGGLQNIKRATLLYAYENLTARGKKFPLIISGVALDELFRGHYTTPNPISNDIANLFQTGKVELDDSFWSNVFNKDYTEFRSTIINHINYLKESFGDYTNSEHHLLYRIYLQGPEYFCGEVKLAEHFSTVRVPAWDSHLLDLAFSISDSTLSFSSFLDNKYSNQEIVRLQSYILSRKQPGLAKLPVRNTRPDIVLKNYWLFKAYTLFRLSVNKIQYIGKRPSPLENWDFWLNKSHIKFVDELIFSRSSRINEYLSKKFLFRLSTNRNTHWIGKLVTLEILLRLINNKWEGNFS
jgi:asparagine synthetase B (glutamine-hydrolysing)